MTKDRLKGFVEFLSLLQNAHERGHESAQDDKSKGYHAGAYNTLTQVIQELGEETK